MVEFIIWFAVFYLGILLSAVVLFVSQIILGISIDRDAKCLGLDCGPVFLVLTILFGAIPAAIYLIVRAENAASSVFSDFSSSARSAKASMITYIIALVLTLVCVFGLMFVVTSNIELLMTLEEAGYSSFSYAYRF